MILAGKTRDLSVNWLHLVPASHASSTGSNPVRGAPPPSRPQPAPAAGSRPESGQGLAVSWTPPLGCVLDDEPASDGDRGAGRHGDAEPGAPVASGGDVVGLECVSQRLVPARYQRLPGRGRRTPRRSADSPGGARPRIRQRRPSSARPLEPTQPPHQHRRQRRRPSPVNAPLLQPPVLHRPTIHGVPRARARRRPHRSDPVKLTPVRVR